MALNIFNDEKEKKFFAEAGGSKCFIIYEMEDANTINLEHTIVPKELGGKGYAAELAEYALKYARENHLKVIPTCSYMIAYLKKHPEHNDLLK